MNKKLFYVAPEMEVIEVEVEAQLMAGSGATGGGSDDIGPDDVDPGFGG